MVKQVKLTLIEGIDLKISDLTGRSDPFCDVKLGDQHKQTQVKKFTLNPRWDETFTFDVTDETMSLKIYVFDKDLTKHDHLGNFIIPLSTLFEGELEAWGRLDEVHQGLIHYKIEAIGFGKKLKNAQVERKYPNLTTVFESLNLSPEEANYVNYRRENAVTTTLKKVFELDEIKNIPTIALCCSGGGMRACTGTCGSVEGLNEAGLIQSLSYFSGLSGSTWFISPMYQLNHQLSTLREALRKSHKVGLTKMGKEAIKDICKAVTKRLVFKKFSLVDFYGCMLAKLYLESKSSDEDFDVYKSSFAKVKKNQLMSEFRAPVPILSAILVREGIVEKEFFRWFEFTPYFCGISQFKTFIPSEMFGCHYKNGSIVNSKFPQEDLGFLMGICGSAFQTSIQYAIEYIRKDYGKISSLLDKILKEETKGKRPKPAVVPNFALGTLNSFSKDQDICLVDAGIMICVPVAPLLRPQRKVDIIILCDYSGNLKEAIELQRAEKHAKEQGLPFPKIDYVGIEKKPISVWRGGDGVPTIIYMPLLHTDGFFLEKKVEKEFPHYGTFKLQYEEDDFDALADLCKYNMKNAIPTIKKEILRVINGEK